MEHGRTQDLSKDAGLTAYNVPRPGPIASNCDTKAENLHDKDAGRSFRRAGTISTLALGILRCGVTLLVSGSRFGTRKMNSGQPSAHAAPTRPTTTKTVRSEPLLREQSPLSSPGKGNSYRSALGNSAGFAQVEADGPCRVRLPSS